MGLPSGPFAFIAPCYADFMPLFSDEIAGQAPHAQRRLYTLFQRAVKAGEIPALRLLTRFALTGSRGQSRQVFDYAYTTAAATQVRAWIDQHQQVNLQRGVTAEQARAMTDEQLAALIKAQRKPVKRHGKRQLTKAQE